MTKNETIAHWESILANEGMAEVCLFDSTGKNAHAITFVSATLEDDKNENWAEQVCIVHNGRSIAISDVDTYEFWHSLAIAVSSLPPGWPKYERELLELYADTGNFEASRRKLGLESNVAYAAKRRFEKWRMNTTG